MSSSSFLLSNLVIPAPISSYNQSGLVPLAVLFFSLIVLALCVHSVMGQFERENSCRIIVLVV